MKTSHYPSLWLCKQISDNWFPKTEIMVESKNMAIDKIDIISYPSIWELLDNIPYFIEIFWWQRRNLIIEHHTVRYSMNSHTFKCTHSNNLPNALAEMWLWLNENGYLTTNNS